MDMSLTAFRDGVSFIVEIETTGPEAYRWFLDGVPGNSEQEAIDWVLARMREQLGVLGGRIDDLGTKID